MTFIWDFEADRKKEDFYEREEKHKFQVNLGGILDILSNHLYKSQDVFLRELLQNGMDAITLRQKQEKDFQDGCITISVHERERIELSDNGAGLTKEEIHRFLAVIGQSSKIGLESGRLTEDYIGRFGIGLLSCFMVSESIEIHTKSLKSEQGYAWIGLPDGTYTLKPVEKKKVGTTVILKARPDSTHYFLAQKVKELVRYYGLVLSVPIYLKGHHIPINNIPEEFYGISRSQLLSFGEWLFEENFLEAIPIQTKHLSGMAYVLSYRTDPTVKMGHRIYLKQMLLTEKGDTLLPPWAFFLRCFLNTRGLRPTASREDFYEDDELEIARHEFEETIKQHFEKLAATDPIVLKCIVDTHVQAIKALSVWDEGLFELFIDYLRFETSEGLLDGKALKKAGPAVWVDDVPKFKQLKPIFMAQGKLLICAGYTYDYDLLCKMAAVFSLPMEPLHEEGMDFILEELDDREEIKSNPFLYFANEVLEEFDCRAILRRFLPDELPTLYTVSGDVQFVRQMQTVKEASGNIFSGALSSLLKSVEEQPLATLYFNLNNDLIHKLLQLDDNQLLTAVIRVLYVQALLQGGHPLKNSELSMMNEELLHLIERRVDLDDEKGI